MRVTNGPKKFKSYPIGFFHIDIAKVSTEGDKLHLFVAIDRTSKLVMAKLADKATMRTLPRIVPVRLPYFGVPL